jgi:hypothetical protein
MGGFLLIAGSSAYLRGYRTAEFAEAAEKDAEKSVHEYLLVYLCDLYALRG